MKTCLFYNKESKHCFLVEANSQSEANLIFRHSYPNMNVKEIRSNYFDKKNKLGFTDLSCLLKDFTKLVIYSKRKKEFLHHSINYLIESVINRIKKTNVNKNDCVYEYNRTSITCSYKEKILFISKLTNQNNVSTQIFN